MLGSGTSNLKWQLRQYLHPDRWLPRVAPPRQARLRVWLVLLPALSRASPRNMPSALAQIPAPVAPGVRHFFAPLRPLHENVLGNTAPRRVSFVLLNRYCRAGTYALASQSSTL